MTGAERKRKMTLADACNAIAKLEEENTLLKGRNEGFEKQIMGLLIKYEGVYKRFPDLKSAMDKAEEVLKENAELKADNDARKFAMAMSEKVEKQLRQENADLKVKVGLSIDYEKAQKDGELCLGYGGDEDEPCERCKNCIKCEGGYYQLGETEKDDQLTKAKELIQDLFNILNGDCNDVYREETISEAENFLKDSEVEK